MSQFKRVSDEDAMRALDVLPPAKWYRSADMEVFQVGEPAAHSGEGKLLFNTYQRVFVHGEAFSWFFVGIHELVYLDDKHLLMASY